MPAAQQQPFDSDDRGCDGRLSLLMWGAPVLSSLGQHAEEVPRCGFFDRKKCLSSQSPQGQGANAGGCSVQRIVELSI